MYFNRHKNILEKVILLLLGYGFLCPFVVKAAQRDISIVDSIAYATLSRNKMLYGIGNIQQIKPSIFLRSSDLYRQDYLTNGNEAFYVYGYSGRDEGFVIVAADDRMPAVLAYSNIGTFTSKDLPASVRYWLECYIDDYKNLGAEETITNNLFSQSNVVRPEGVNPLLGVLPWGQDAPFNNLCPQSSMGRCVTGCVATAMAQVMWLHQWPACGTGEIIYNTLTHQIPVRLNLVEHPFQWDLIKKEYQKGKYTDEEANAVATLMLACGAAVRMDYSPNGSGAFQYDILKALVNNFGYDPDAAFLPREYFSHEDWNRLLISELNEGRAVNYAGQSRTDGGHSFVIDGYEYDRNISNIYYHLNWGWDGMCNGYYLLPQLRPAENGKYYAEEGFNEGQQMIIGVCPDDGETEANKMMYAEKIKVMQSFLNPGETTIIQINTLTNLCYRTFKGSLSLQLTDSIGNKTVIGNIPIEPILYFESQNDLLLPFIIPDTLREGVYSVKILGINEAGYNSEIYSLSSPQITISNPYNNIEDKNTLLCSSEFEVFKEIDMENNINLRVYELFNYSNDNLSGYLQIELATDYGVHIATISEPVWVPTLEPQEISSSPYILNCTIPDTLSNGDYRIYVLFYPSEHSLSNRVKYYERINPTNIPTEYFLQMSINEEKYVIDGLSFPKVSTSIINMTERIIHTGYYSLQGIQYMDKPLQKNIYIRNGKKVIIR